MATAWKVAAATAMLGWLVSPVISFLLPKILSSLGFDAKKKLRELEIQIIPELKKMLHEVDQERMLRRGLKDSDDVAVLDRMAAMLRHAREEAEDVFDDQHEIDVYRNRCWQRLCGVMKALARIVVSYGRVKACIGVSRGAVKASFARCLGLARIVRSGSARLLQWARNWLKKPVHVNENQAATEDQVLPTSDTGVSDEEAVSQATPLGSTSGPVMVASCSSFEVFKNHCRSIFYWLIAAFGALCFYRNWSYEVAGLTNYEENALDFLVTAISRWSLKKRIEKVESTISEVKNSSLLGVASKSAPDDVANKNRSRIRTASNRKVFGREELLYSIMEKLRENPHGNSPCYSVLGIHGVAGSGKTTFARYIRDYIEEECKEEKLFDTIMCIHVSETFSVDDIFHEMLKDITKERHSNISHHEDLKEKLKESLHGKRFFLILDDLWVKTKNDPQLEELISPLTAGLKGSRVLVTARTKVAAGALCVDEPMEMPYLDEDKYLSMFMHYALGGTHVHDTEFEQVGRVIAEKLHGSPIAAVIVAGRLGANRDINFWKNTAERDMLNDTMDALWWSYQQLSSDIKRCFEFCNIFPRRLKMRKDDLIHLWIAQGFVKTSYAREDMEDVAEAYIQELVSCSFMQQAEKPWYNEEFIIIHDLLHDLTDMLTRTDCFRIENTCIQTGETWKVDIPRDVRHLFIQNYDAKLIAKEIVRLGYLRTLIINVVGRDTQVEENDIDNICKKLPKLRVLAVASQGYTIVKPKKLSIPESIGQLKHLRYLAFRTIMDSYITLPCTLNQLKHIQLLDFGWGHILKFNLAKLVSLRHIVCWQGVELLYIGKLSALQTLSGFTVSNEQGCELKQLRDLNKLRGTLHISGLQNVKSKEQALQANLATKRLTELKLQWPYHDGTRASPEVQTDVLDGLCPPLGLKTLRLYNFLGWRYPDWTVGNHMGGLKNLQELYIIRCRKQISTSGLYEAFPYLRVLWFFYCSWDALPENMERLTSLNELLILSCENIQSLPTLPQSLQKFTLTSCSDELMESCKTVGHPNRQKIERIPYISIY